MRKNVMIFILGAIVGMTGLGILSASRGSDATWTDRDIYRIIGLLEQIAENTARR